MRVLFLNARLADRGGADRWLLAVLSALQSRVDTRLAVGRVDSVVAAAEGGRIGPWSRVKGLDDGAPGRSRPATAGRVQALIDDLAPDVIHVNDVTDPGVLEVVARTGRGILTAQDHRFFCPGRGKVDRAGRICHEPMGVPCAPCFDDPGYADTVIGLTARRLRAVLGMRRIVVLSRYMADELRAVGVPGERLVCLPPFVDGFPNGLAADTGQGEYHLLASRLAEHKGVRIAVEAARRMRNRLPLLIAGAGPMDDAVRAAARRADGRIRMVGWADRKQLSALLRGARSLWLPSLWAEPFGIAGIEAMAHGVPVIASDVGGVRDWLRDGETGILVAPGSAAALAEAADRLAEDPAWAAQLGRWGQRRQEREFSADRTVRGLLVIYRATIRHLS